MKMRYIKRFSILGLYMKIAAISSFYGCPIAGDDSYLLVIHYFTNFNTLLPALAM